MNSREFWLCILILFGITPVTALSITAKPIWHPPIYVELPVGWTVKPGKSIDSQIFELRKEKQKVIFDYGLRSNAEEVRCQIDEITRLSDLQELKCISSVKEAHYIKQVISIDDPEDKRFHLSVSIHLDSSGALDKEMLTLLKSIQFTGKLDALKLISVERSLESARVIDESGKSRSVKRGDVVSRNHGAIREIAQDHILVEDFILTSEGDFQRRRTTLQLPQGGNQQ